MNHGSLFSGIGAADLAASWLGWNNVFQVEIDDFCMKILERHFPTTERYRDRKAFDGTKYQGRLDIISGGFPCQPFSSMSKERLGQRDERYLWPEMLRVIRQIKPSYVLGENVIGLLSTGHETVCLDLEREGYEVETIILPAAALGAPHLSNRVFILADSTGAARQGMVSEGSILQESKNRQNRVQETRRDAGEYVSVWESAPPPFCQFCGMDDGIPDRIHRIKALGNAIVPQVIFEIFKALDSWHRVGGFQLSESIPSESGRIAHEKT
jgi:DNA (cytosine-5)-methyltransferase 1